jgi:hypothetical protein
MGNINITVSIKPGILLDTDGDPIVVTGECSYNILLNPYYAMEYDIARVFLEDYLSYTEDLRRIIFESSIYISEFTLEDSNMSPEQIFRLKRQYVICRSVYNFGRIFHRDYMTAVKKSKFLADFKVSLEVQNDPSMIKSILEDAKECYEEIESLMHIMSGNSGFSTFVLGKNNPCNKTSSRQWWPSHGDGTPKIPLAARKAENFCHKYKIGSQSI